MTMRMRLWVGLAAMLAFAAPQVAHAQDSGRAAFAEFRDVCIAANGDAAYALGKLRAQGWVPAPDELAKAMQQEVGPDAVMLLNFDVETLTMKTPGPMGLALALIGTAPAEAFGGFAVTGPFCAIAPMVSDVGSVRRSFEAHYPFEPYESDEGALWIFTQENGAVVPASPSVAKMDELEALALIRSAPHYVAGVMQEDETAILLFMQLVP